MVKIYVINLAKDTDKRASMEQQLERLKFQAEYVDAVYGKELPKTQFWSAVSKFRWWCAVGRSIEPAEVGCALSHYGIYKKMSESVCILEDDIILSDNFVQVLKNVERFVDPARPQVIMLSNHANSVADGADGVIRRDHSAICTDGYVITPMAAERLLKANLPLQVPCDHWGRWERRGLIELYHAFPSVVKQDQDTFGSSTSGGRKSVKDYTLIHYLMHKCKRLVGVTIDHALERFCR